jgi:hypothetical protein
MTKTTIEMVGHGNNNPNVSSQPIQLSLYKLGSDGIGREDVSTRLTFRFYTKHDYS